jgi:chromosome segregation ATPase
MELEASRSRIIELENRCRHFESSAHQRETDVRQLQDECLAASDKLRQLQLQIDWLQKSPPGQGIGGQDKDIGRMQQYYEEEIRSLREQLANAPRNFTDKSVSMAEYQDMRLKLEKLEIELSHRTQELHATQARSSAAEEQMKDMKRHFTIIKESNSAKEAQMQLLQSDVSSANQR